MGSNLATPMRSSDSRAMATLRSLSSGSLSIAMYSLISAVRLLISAVRLFWIATSLITITQLLVHAMTEIFPTLYLPEPPRLSVVLNPACILPVELVFECHLLMDVRLHHTVHLSRDTRSTSTHEDRRRTRSDACIPCRHGLLYYTHTARQKCSVA